MTFPASLRLLILSILLLFPGWAMAESSPKPGVYIAEEGRGILEIISDKDGKLDFSIETLGVNFHTCRVEGTIRDGTATLESAWDTDDNICTVTFKQKDGIVAVGTTDACRSFCGARASFDWEYLTPAPGCTPDQLRKTRDTFKTLYDSKSYAKARATLEPVLKKCNATLHELVEKGPIRNDLAVTYHKLGDYAACRSILAPYAEDAAKKDEDVDAYSYAPDQQYIYRLNVAAARTNLVLCDKTKKAARSSAK